MSGWWLVFVVAIAPTIAVVFLIMNRFDKHETGDKL